jgi:endonuclease/exonuclease/phosphatase family metal-dependent hydrolase
MEPAPVDPLAGPERHPRGTGTPRAEADRTALRLLSYNIQTGLTSERYRHYVTRSWQHVLPHPSRWANLDQIAAYLSAYDVVGLQEVDSGSLRTGFVNQTQYLADRARFPHWYHQVNRRIGRLAQQSNGLLSRIAPTAITDLKLPGLPGRGALVARFGSGPEPLLVFIIHLALGKRARLRQMAFLADRVAEHCHTVVMGDLNCEPESEELQLLLGHTGLCAPVGRMRTFPSWHPRRHIDHILVSPSLTARRAYVPEWPFSDHLPVAMEVVLPQDVWPDDSDRAA